jgi:hypothetical protein
MIQNHPNKPEMGERALAFRCRAVPTALPAILTVVRC